MMKLLMKHPMYDAEVGGGAADQPAAPSNGLPADSLSAGDPPAGDKPDMPPALSAEDIMKKVDEER